MCRESCQTKGSADAHFRFCVNYLFLFIRYIFIKKFFTLSSLRLKIKMHIIEILNIKSIEFNLIY